MNKLVMMVLVAVTGCSASPLGVGDDASRPRQQCAYTVTMPFVASGVPVTADCIPPESAGGDIYHVSFRAVDSQHDAVFDFHAQSGEHDAQDPGFHLYSLILNDWTCADWNGATSFHVDAAAWHLHADLVCSYETGRSVQLDVSGTR